ncbi:MAG: response regulator transcription factor [Actinobacteria bacterium]|nr:response regulator transcription factor [Actinomycetota bacterium]
MGPGQSVSQAVFRTVLADDVADLRLLYRVVLERSGRFQVVAEAVDGVEAVEYATRHQPDLVLLDVAMPNMDGITALPGIVSASPHTKVVMLSAFERRRLNDVAEAGGASRYLEKGITPAQLVEELLTVMEDRVSS